MNKLLNIYLAPTKTFLSLKEKSEWVVPFITVLLIISITAAVIVGMNKGTMIAKQQTFMREKGMTEEQIEQATKITSGPIPIIASALSVAIITIIIFLVFSTIINLFLPIFGGKSAFKLVFSVVCFSSLIKVPAAILKLVLMAIAKTLFVATSLALFVPNLAKTSFGYQLLNGFDFFIIWEMILVAIGISITNEIKRQHAYVLVFIIWLASIFIGIGLGSITGSNVRIS